MAVTATLQNDKGPELFDIHKRERYGVSITATPGAPTPGSGAGTSPGAITAVGSDYCHTLTVNTGTAPPGSNAVLVTVPFGNTMTAAPRVLMVPANANAAALSGATEPFVDDASTTTGQYVVKVGTTGLAASTTYKWYMLAADALVSFAIVAKWITTLKDVVAAGVDAPSVTMAGNTATLNVTPFPGSGQVDLLGAP